ncbi:MAG: anaerobic glycerol-3-phosphate dehydrogenase subunit GlpA [Syntrophaceticus sp.]
MVIGGGATGAGILWDLALRGIDAVLVEQRELAYGTSGRCHGLLHSGGRYVVRDGGVARECYQENQILRRVAAGAVEETGGLFVHLKGDDPDYVERWVDASKSAGIPFEEMDLSEAHRLEPLLSKDARRVFWVPDAAVDPFDLVMINVQGAVERGAKVLTCTRVEKLLVEEQRVRGAVLKDLASGEVFPIKADVVINAAGPWAGQVAATAGVPLELAYGKGTLLVYSQRLNRHVINRLRQPGDGDILVPAKTVSLLGTTDLPTSTPENPQPTGEEVKTLLDLGEELIPGLANRRIVRAFAGVRPLYDPGEGTGRQASRGFAVIDHEKVHGLANFYSVLGGKLTTYRLMAEQVVDLVAAKLGVFTPCRTKDTCLPSPAISAEVSHEGGQKDSTQNQGTSLICECEMLDKNTFLHAARLLGSLTPGALLRNTRLAHGPCQGTTCIYRSALLLYQEKLLSYEGCQEFIKKAFRSRGQGLGHLLQGDQARQLELARGIYLQNLQLGDSIGDSKDEL